MQIENVCGLYSIECTANGAIYFGSARNIANRWRQHRYDLHHGKHSNSRMLRCWRKYGEGAFRFCIIAILEPSVLMDTEAALLATVVGMPHVLNMSAVPTGGMTGRRHTAESRAKMGAMRGRKHSPETRAKMSRSQSRRVLRPHTGPNISAALKLYWARRKGAV